jgi:hypothetical protein
MFCAPRLVFGGIVGVGFLFHVLSCRTCFWRYRGRRVPFSCFALPDSFSVVPRVSGLVFMFYAPEIIFGGSEGVRSLFHVLRSQTYFRPYRGRRVLFSCFALPVSFSTVMGVSGPVFMFCAPKLIFGGTDGVASSFHVLRSRICFRRYRGRRVLFSCFALLHSFSVVPRASGPVLNILRSWTHFHRYRGPRVPYSCFSLSESILTVSRASGPVFMFLAPEHIFNGTMGVRFFFHVLRCRTHFRRSRRRRVPFSYFALPDSFTMVPWVSCPVFIFCAPENVFRRTVGVGSCFHDLRSQTRFRRYRGLLVQFSWFALPDAFSTIEGTSGPVFMFCALGQRASEHVFLFCALGLVFGGSEGVGSIFALPNSFSAVPCALGPF